MIALSAADLTKFYDGVNEVFTGVSFSVNSGDRIGIIGPNGAGKSTLLNILSGEDSCESGNVYIAKDLTVGYFHQNDLFTSTRTIYQEMLSVFQDVIDMEDRLRELSGEIARLSENGGGDLEKTLAEYDRLQAEFERRDGYSYKSEIAGVLSSLDFGDAVKEKYTGDLSGGERTRLALGLLLLKKPDLLFLDEPTNHLDISTLKWLEQYIRNYQGTVLIISHDRYFLDRTVNRIFELDNHRLSIYEGNYTFYVREHKIRRASELKAYENQQAELKRQRELISRYKQRGTEKLAKRAKSREKALEKKEILDRPAGEHARIKMRFQQDSVSGNDTLHAENVSMTVGTGDQKRMVLRDVSFDIKRGERVCIIGPNGAGKSTLLKMIMSELIPDSGFIKVGHNIDFGYYDQEQSMLNESSTVLEEMRSAYSLYSDTELRNLLGRFLFRGEDVFRPVSVLSGGERARLSLLKLMMSGANMLILDEPTNHLDIESREVFEDALVEFPGTSVIVSHDRYFLNKVPTQIYELKEGRITVYRGGYDYYLEKSEELNSPGQGMSFSTSPSADGSSSAVDQKGQSAVSDKEKRLQARREVKEKQAEARRRDRRIEELEKKIAVLEDEIRGLEEEMCRDDYLKDHVKLMELSGEVSDKKAALEEAYGEWAELAE